MIDITAQPALSAIAFGDRVIVQIYERGVFHSIDLSVTAATSLSCALSMAARRAEIAGGLA